MLPLLLDLKLHLSEDQLILSSYYQWTFPKIASWILLGIHLLVYLLTNNYFYMSLNVYRNWRFFFNGTKIIYIKVKTLKVIIYLNLLFVSYLQMFKMLWHFDFSKKVEVNNICIHISCLDKKYLEVGYLLVWNFLCLFF